MYWPAQKGTMLYSSLLRTTMPSLFTRGDADDIGKSRTNTLLIGHFFSTQKRAVLSVSTSSRNQHLAHHFLASSTGDDALGFSNVQVFSIHKALISISSNNSCANHLLASSTGDEAVFFSSSNDQFFPIHKGRCCRN